MMNCTFNLEFQFSRQLYVQLKQSSSVQEIVEEAAGHPGNFDLVPDGDSVVRRGEPEVA